MLNKILLITGVSTIIYYNYIELLKWTNNFYKRLTNSSCLNPSYVDKVVFLNENIYYYITLKNRQFITTDKKYDLEQYDLFIKNKTAINSPDNILEADIITTDDREIDVLDDIKLLCGPYVNQFNKKNKYWLFNYLAYEYTELNSSADIKELTIALINFLSFKNFFYFTSKSIIMKYKFFIYITNTKGFFIKSGII